MMHWYVIHTKPRQEDVALLNLTRQGYECYLPRIQLEKLRRRRPILVEEPLFPRYLFIRLDSTGTQGQSWSPIRSTKGVSQLVKFGDQAVQVDGWLIPFLREREGRQLDKLQHPFRPGEKVKVIEGPFSGLEAVYQMADAESRALILIDLLSKPTAMRISPAKLQAAEE